MEDGAKTRPRPDSRVLLCGYYGEHNLGDDALLATLLATLPPSCRVVVTARDQHQVQAQFGVSTCPRGHPIRLLLALVRTQVLVLGGGSLLQDSTSRRSLLYYVALILAARLLGAPRAAVGPRSGAAQCPRQPSPGPAESPACKVYHMARSPIGRHGRRLGHSCPRGSGSGVVPSPAPRC